MSSGYVQRHTSLHPALWWPYKITAYPVGFYSRSSGEHTPPAWEPNAMNIDARGGYACMTQLWENEGACATLEEAMDLCWQHYALLH